MEVLTKEQKLKRAQAAIHQFQKKNETANITIGDEEFGKIELVKSDVWAFDYLTKLLPRGNFTHISGASGVGKSTLSLRLIASLQRQGMVCALANNERRYSSEWAQANGVNIKELVGGNYQDLEQCLDFMIKVAEEGVVDCFVVDTITSLASRSEMMDKKGERSTDDNTMALIPRKLSQFFRMATARVHNSKMVVILIGQVRKNLGSYIVTDKATGGNALEHYKTLDISFRKMGKKDWPMDENDHPIGHKLEATLLKATHSMKAKTGDSIQFNFFQGKGFDNEYDIVQYGIETGVIELGGKGNYTFKTDKKEVNVTAKKNIAIPKLVTELKSNKMIESLRVKVEEALVNYRPGKEE